MVASPWRRWSVSVSPCFLLALVAALDVATAAEAPSDPEVPAPTAERVRGLEVVGAWAPSGVRFEQEFVVGTTGGASVSTVAARLAASEWAFETALPMSAFWTPDGRQLGLGNVQVGASYALPIEDGIHHVIGVSVHTNVGEHSYTWVNDAEQLWPSSGFSVSWQGRTASGPVTVGYRGSVGLTWPAAYQPFPNQFATAGGAVCADFALREEVGVVLEGSFAYWEISPLNAAALGRVEVLGATGRLGVVLPLFTWLGASPAEFAGGVTEVVVVADLAVAF